MAHTSICDVCDVLMEHPTEGDANEWVFAHVRDVHETVIEEADVIDLADGGTETFIWPRKLALEAGVETDAVDRLRQRASTTGYLFMRTVRSAQ